VSGETALFRDHGKVFHGSIYSVKISKRLNLLFVSNSAGQLKQIDLDDLEAKDSLPVIKDVGTVVKSGIIEM
jgi:hypothetical protein